MRNPESRRSGITLLEIFIALVLLSTVAALVIPDMRPGIAEQLRSAGRVVAAELDYARNLAVTFNSHYRVTFNQSLNQVVIQHSGSDTTLHALPPSPNRSPSDPPDQQILSLTSLPGIRESVTIFAATAGLEGDPLPEPAEVEFGPLGETAPSGPTIIWLTAGAGDAARYLAIEIHPLTGIARLHDPQRDLPSSLYGKAS
ncbi:MAG: hypothetical protein GTO53_14095 [Planctomycetales bacterium]|nr:hypothetical protein [Planctomycetales bacterium]NIM10219.1 hypothetical protein [Planctomycetales bacterium]NIN09635.1 hypothetical protein [Planctomycetales bacterium]NIN78691.1 hypothetical protein [Planctomycetales bacterium]NIO35936.1 hypothetical protein [Planctomycetales bacterium]